MSDETVVSLTLVGELSDVLYFMNFAFL